MYAPDTQDGGGTFVQHADYGCNPTYYMHKDDSKEPILEGTECSTDSDMSVFLA